MYSSSILEFTQRWSNIQQLPIAGIPKQVYFLIVALFFENISVYGIIDFHHEVYGEFIHKNVVIYDNYQLLTNFCAEVSMLIVSLFADAYFCKLWVILILAIPQIVGLLIIILSSYTFHSLNYAYSIGYAVYVFGKSRLPIIISFGADQFDRKKSKELFIFCTLFAYCMGKFFQGCFLPRVYKSNDPKVLYFYALLLLAMIISNVAILSGINVYEYSMKNINTLRFWHCIIYALFKKIGSYEKHHHWLYHAKEKFNEDFIAHVRRQLHLILILLVIPIFSALYNFLNYIWSLQGEQMEPELLNVVIRPQDLMSLAAIIPALLAPVFAFVVFPNVQENSALSSHNRRLIFAGFLASCAFIMSGFVQILARLPSKPFPDETNLYIYNPLPCKLAVMFTNYKVVDLEQHGKYEELQIRVSNAGLKEVRVKDELPCKHLAHKQNLTWSPTGGESYALIFSFSEDKKTSGSLIFKFAEERCNWFTAEKGKVNIRILYAYDPRGFKVDKIVFDDKQRDRQYSFPTPSNFGITRYARVWDGKYEVCVVVENETMCGSKYLVFRDHYVYNIVATSWLKNDTIEAIPFVAETANVTNILYQVPQYWILACSEILMYVSMIDYAYAEAIEGTSCTVLSVCFMYYFTGSYLDTILRSIIIATNPNSMVFVHMFFAIFLFVLTLIFAICSASYKDKVDLDDDIQVVHDILEQIEITKRRRSSAPY